MLKYFTVCREDGSEGRVASHIYSIVCRTAVVPSNTGRTCPHHTGWYTSHRILYIVHSVHLTNVSPRPLLSADNKWRGNYKIIHYRSSDIPRSLCFKWFWAPIEILRLVYKKTFLICSMVWFDLLSSKKSSTAPSTSWAFFLTKCPQRESKEAQFSKKYPKNFLHKTVSAIK